MKLFEEKTISWDWNPEKYELGFEKEENAPETECSCFFSSVSESVRPVARLNGQILEALLSLRKIKNGQSKGGFVKDHKGNFLIETDETANGTFWVFYNPKISKFLSSVQKPASHGFEPLNYSSNCALPFLMSVLLYAADSDPGEAEKCLNTFFISDNYEELKKAACTISDNVYRRCRYADTVSAPINIDIENVGLLTEKTLKQFTTRLSEQELQSEITGSIYGLEGIEAKPAPVIKVPATTKTGFASLRGNYSINPTRVYTEEEKKLIPVVPDTYQVTKPIMDVCNIILRSSALPNPVRNYMFVGPAGSGKSEACKGIASNCYQPVLHFAAGPNTDEIDLLSRAVPDGHGSIKFVDSTLVTAIKNGYICEITEADLILKPGTLGILNGLMDKTGKFTNSEGEIIERHPDCILIFTMNGNYEGCRRLNQAFKSRCMVIPFELPTDKELLGRIKSESGLEDEEIINDMITINHNVEDYLTSNMLEDGQAGARTLIDWAKLIALGFDPYEAAKMSIVYQWTNEVSEHSALMNIVATQFAPIAIEI